MTDSATDSSQTIRIEVFLRKCAPPDVIDTLRETVARLRRLEERNGETDVRVKTWGSVRPAIEALSDSGLSVALTVDAFQSWADREGYTLTPAFERHETPSRGDHGTAAEEIRVPVVCVAVYEEGDIECVAPCSDGDRIYSVEDCLSALEEGRTTPFTERDGSSDRSSGRPRESVVEKSE
ncbi:HTH domain-containing protein [Natrinema marinum]|uniref:HTH domain-containing protein n=1 Tax=Natrinema marinum TaxID=2961598 RepID=UPI0020C8F5F1|nr:HTH domain-containing protein [Natrinema marinum]